MTKTLNQFIEEGYLKVKSSDEQKFVDKHVAVANPDRNGNGDDVFKGAKVKTINRRKERKGYDAGDDEKVYEEAELDEAFFHYAGTKHPNENSVKARIKDVHVKLMKSGYRPVHGSPDHSKIEVDGHAVKYSKPGTNHEIHVTASSMGSTLRHNPSPFHVYVDKHPKSVNKFTSRPSDEKSFAKSSLVKKANEEAELAEMGDQDSYGDPNSRYGKPGSPMAKNPSKMISKKRASSTSSNLFNKIMDKHTKYSKANEEVEQIDELSRDLLMKYNDANEKDREEIAYRKLGMIRNNKMTPEQEKHDKKLTSRVQMGWLASKKTYPNVFKGKDAAKVPATRKEEVEQIDELSKETAAKYSKASYSNLDYNKRKLDKHEWEKSSVDAGMRIPGRNRDVAFGTNDDKTLTYSPKDIKGINKNIGKRLGGLNRAHKIMHKEETLVDILSGLKESHIRTMVEVYESLSEENQAKFVATCKKDGGIDAMLNFAIKNRGE